MVHLILDNCVLFVVHMPLHWFISCRSDESGRPSVTMAEVEALKLKLQALPTVQSVIDSNAARTRRVMAAIRAFAMESRRGR